jgi:hypothetical protein
VGPSDIMAWAGSKRSLILGIAVALAGCVAPDVAPLPRPRLPPAQMPAPPLLVESAESAAARAYYNQVQQALLSQGLLRSDGGETDTPFTDRMLADTFVRVALYDEFAPGSGGQVARTTPSKLNRWEAPVRVGLRFGASVSADRRGTDGARVASYLAHLSQVTGHSIRLDDANPNFFVYIVNEDERRALGPTLNAALPGLNAATVEGVTNLPRSTYCIVLAQPRGNSGVYTRAFAVVRAEHPDLLRLSCIHEEIAQGLGLPNDSSLARPSIFNDDEEFALLTRMDEAMLRMLYDPALRPGMTEAEARPIVNSLARRLLGGET